MNCREFRRKHDAFIDDTLSGVELERMASHRRLCEQCAHLDTRVRRALLVARNVPMIDVSPAFSERLQARLDVERAARRLMQSSSGSTTAMWRWGQLSGTYAMVAAGVLAAAGLAGVAMLSGNEDDVIRLAPVVASAPAPEASVLMTPTMVAAVPAGMPLWSAVFVAQQASYHFASDEASH
jgi:hypothetical protein